MLDRTPTDKFSSDKDLAHRSAKAKLEFVTANLAALAKVDRGGSAQRAAKSMLSLLRNGEELTPGQLDYCDGLYEKVMKGFDLPSVGLHSDRKRRGLKFG